MKKKVKGMVASIVAVIILVGMLIVLLNLPSDAEEDSSSQATSSDVSVIINEKESDEVEQVEVSNETGDYTIRTVDNGEYGIVGISNLTPLDTKITALLEDASNLTAQSLIEENPANLSQYGLEKPKATVTIGYFDDKSVQLKVGDDTPTGSGVYVQVVGTKSVYIFESSRVDSFLIGQYDYIDPTIVPAKETSDDASSATEINAKKITLEGTAHKQPLVLELNEGEDQVITQYYMTSPKQHDADADMTAHINDSIYGLTADSVAAVNPTDEELETYGLKEPYVKMTAVFDDETITLSASEPKDGSVYVMNGKDPIVYQIAEDSVPWVSVTYEDAVSSLVITPNIAGVKALTLQTEDKTYTFDIAHVTEDDSTTNTVSYEGEELDMDNFSTLYTNVIMSRHQEFTDEKPQADEKPALTVTFTYDDAGKTDDVIEYYKASERMVYIVLNGDCESMEYTSYIDKLVKDCEKVIKGQEITTVN